MNTKYHILLLTLLAAINVFSQSNNLKKKEKEVNEMLNAWKRNNDSPGVAVAILKDGNVLYKKCFGSANLEYEIPIRPNSVFQVASLSKQFTKDYFWCSQEVGQ